jgi:hypothetical protein
MRLSTSASLPALRPHPRPAPQISQVADHLAHAATVGQPPDDLRGSLASAVPVDVLTEIEIARPRDEVATFASDPTNAILWYKNIRSVEWETPPPVAVGSRLRFVVQFLGRTLRYTYEIREMAPGATS